MDKGVVEGGEDVRYAHELPLPAGETGGGLAVSELAARGPLPPSWSILFQLASQPATHTAPAAQACPLASGMAMAAAPTGRAAPPRITATLASSACCGPGGWAQGRHSPPAWSSSWVPFCSGCQGRAPGGGLLDSKMGWSAGNELAKRERGPELVLLAALAQTWVERERLAGHGLASSPEARGGE